MLPNTASDTLTTHIYSFENLNLNYRLNKLLMISPGKRQTKRNLIAITKPKHWF